MAIVTDRTEIARGDIDIEVGGEIEIGRAKRACLRRRARGVLFALSPSTLARTVIVIGCGLCCPLDERMRDWVVFAIFGFANTTQIKVGTHKTFVANAFYSFSTPITNGIVNKRSLRCLSGRRSSG